MYHNTPFGGPMRGRRIAAASVSLTPTPTANITVGKSRLRVYRASDTDTDTDSVYVGDGQEFEIELFNPTQHTCAAEIKINGEPIGDSMIVLRPGARVHLERFLSSDRRFKFSTYVVDGSAEAKEAIAQNGDVSVAFYYEKPKREPSRYAMTTNSLGGLRSRSAYADDIAAPLGAQFKSMNFADDIGATMDWMEQVRERSVDTPAPVETGRVEEGSRSDQRFSRITLDTNSYPSLTTRVKMLPISQLPVEKDDVRLRLYCTKCGRRQREGENFCPQDGARY